MNPKRFVNIFYDAYRGEGYERDIDEKVIHLVIESFYEIGDDFRESFMMMGSEDQDEAMYMLVDKIISEFEIDRPSLVEYLVPSADAIFDLDRDL